ncbi:hypothetical protein AA313_de0208620 [Arthrobotrys entomopaga]|nr:hypothetical protein AA313_de0208620 [Arthrobotrys entomopaga]
MRFVWTILLTAATVAADGCPAPPLSTRPSTLATSMTITSMQPPPPKCTTDACLLAVITSNVDDTTDHFELDCHSYVKTTYIPPTITLPLTLGPSDAATETVTASSSLPTDQKLTHTFPTLPPVTGTGSFITPTLIPTFYSACSGSVHFSSACSCVGTTGTITTGLTPIVDFPTITPTTTFTVITSAAATYRPFFVKASPEYYWALQPAGSAPYVELIADNHEAQTFYYDPTTKFLHAEGVGLVYVHASQGAGPVGGESPLYLSKSSDDQVELQCDIDANNVLSCSIGSLVEFGSADEGGGAYYMLIAGTGHDFTSDSDRGFATDCSIEYVA